MTINNNKHKERCRKYYAKNKASIKARRIKNKKHIKKQRHEYYLANKKLINEYSNTYKITHKEHVTKYRKVYNKRYRSKHKDYFREYQRKYMANRITSDPIFKLKKCLRTLLWNSVNKLGYKKKSKTEQILGCSFDKFKAYIESKFIKGMTWLNYGEWHLDHKIPLAIAKTEEEVLRLNHYTNLQPLWAIDNLIKSDTINLQNINRS